MADKGGAPGWGLSPRVRGSPRQSDDILHPAGSIPAGAGEPMPLFASRVLIWVYPRGCGGARLSLTAPKARVGLSPRVRGSL